MCGAYINMRTVTTGKDISARRYEYFWCSPGTYPDVGTRGRAFVPPNSMKTIHGVSPHIIGFGARGVVRVSGAGRRFGVVEDRDGDEFAGATAANRHEIWGPAKGGVGRYFLIVSSLSGVDTGMDECFLGFPSGITSACTVKRGRRRRGLSTHFPGRRRHPPALRVARYAVRSAGDVRTRRRDARLRHLMGNLPHAWATEVALRENKAR